MFKVPELPYKYDALGPTISEETMRLHHDKHHQAYVDKLNSALEIVPEWHDKSIEDILQNLEKIPENIRTMVRNNGGGHYNHSLFWQWMTPDRTEPGEKIKHALSERYGSFEAFKEEFTNKATTLFGSGWCWLLNDLTILTTYNQDSPIMEGKNPILGLDVWEHAYYLDYRNVRADYIKKWWDVVNWQKVSELYA
jgi:Fe-Mn family superoxide dismutase